MQKQVSKQSLAIVALSILLAICMALTATYAAFAKNVNVTGNITFVSPELIITTDGNATGTGFSITGEGEDGALVITLQQQAFTINSDETAQLTADAKAALAAITFAVASTTTISSENKIQITALAYSTEDIDGDGEGTELYKNIASLLPLNASLTQGTAGVNTVGAQVVFGTPVDTLTAAQVAALTGSFKVVLTANIVAA